MREAGSELWALRAMRELDDALLNLRFNFETVGLLLLRTQGDAPAVLAADKALWSQREDGFAREVLLHMRRVFKRLDMTARSTFALVEEGSCFAGSLLELALAADRTYMKDDPDAAAPCELALSELNQAWLTTANGLSRLQSRYLYDPAQARKLAETLGRYDAGAAMKAGLVTATPDAIDWDDEVRMAIEERASLSPDALTGMEASLRFPGPETMESKIFARLSAWQNWIFIRPNATGERGALTMYGKPERPEFDWRRT
jgi:benzoyl-CoA-dihydrodiol lyase